jgi:AraC-like DNA-binding protein
VGFLCRKYNNYNEVHTHEFIPSLSNIISYIENNYTKDIKLDFLADMANMSVNSIINIFKKTFNTTPLNYIISLRIRKACEIMMYTDKSLTHIALDTGFCDSNYFSRVFKKVMGTTPSEYRNKYTNCV